MLFHEENMKKKAYIVIYFIIFWIVIPGILYFASLVLDKSFFSGGKLPSGTVIPGYILGISGLALLLLTIHQFKRFSGEFPVSATPPAEIIQRGVFAIWRHPIYLFASVMLSGIAFIIRSKALLFIVIPLFILLVILYVIREESILIKRFGNQYLWYKKNVPLIIPHSHQWIKIPGFILFKVLFRLRVNNRENIPSSLPFIVISGHRHYFDPFLISYTIPVPLKHISTFEMFRSPLIRRIFSWFGVIPRKRFAKDFEGTQKVLSALRSGYSICMFAEGGRSWTGKLRTFKPESIRLLQHMNSIQVVPVRIEGNYHSWPRWANHLTPGNITVTVEKPIFADKDADPGRLENALRNIVEPRQEIEDTKLYHRKNRIENLSRVIYRCPVCLNPETPDEIPPDALYCSACKNLAFLRPDLKLEIKQQDSIITKSIPEIYDYVKVRYSDIYNILPEDLIHKYSQYLEPGEKLIILSPCQLWTETNSVFKPSLKGVCLLSDKTITITNNRDKQIIALHEISAATIESNYKLQIYNESGKVLYQITFDNESVLKYQDLLEVIIKELYNKKITTR